jgi:hypothetical protein
VIDHAVSCAAGLAAPTVFDAWRELLAEQSRWGRERGYPPLLSQFGATFIERAIIEAYCRATRQTLAEAARANAFGLRLEEFDRRLAERLPGALLPSQARRQIIARHTVGMADPLEDGEIEKSARLNDGLPQSLAECIRRYGLKHFKLKLSGNAEPDIDRLTRIAGVIERHAAGEIAFTLDGNESFRALESFREYWERLSRSPNLLGFFERMMFVEQPFHRDVALDGGVLGELAKWNERPRLIIDESDAELDSLARALELGYHGTSHKNCKGVFKGIANACLLKELRRRSPDSRLVMSGEDLANTGPVALLQDLAVVATLGVSSVERNGHHYFAGLSAFSPRVQEQILGCHGDLYQPSPGGWPTLSIVDGQLSVGSIVDAPLGVGFELDLTQFVPRARWSAPKHS